MQIDMSHIHYVHSDSFGNQDRPEIQDMKVDQYTYNINGTFRCVCEMVLCLTLFPVSNVGSFLLYARIVLLHLFLLLQHVVFYHLCRA